MPAVERRRPRRREDAAALAHGGEDAGRALVHRRQFSRPVSADGVVDGAGEGPAVRRAGRGRHAHDQARSSSRSCGTSGRRRYPYAIDRGAGGARARAVLLATTSDAPKCHGVYDGRGNVEWPGVHTDVGTDRSRIDVVSDGFIDAFNSSPLAAEGALVKSRGLCGDAADRRVGELPVPAQRQRADAAPSARAPCRSGRRSSR